MIELGLFTNDDFNRLMGWIVNEEELIQFAGPIFKYPLTEVQLSHYLKDKNRIVYKVSVLPAKEIIGHCEIYISESSAKLCRILIGNRSYRGKGLGLEIINKLVNICFNELNFNYAELNVYDWNIPAVKCYEKAGFILNPEKSKTIVVNNKPWTSVNMFMRKDFFVT